MLENSLIVYENSWIINRIYEVSDAIRHRVVDQVKFEERCIERVGRYLNKSPGRINNKKYIERMIWEVAKISIGLFKKDETTLMSEMITENDNGEDVEFEPTDVLADVESEVMAKEITALLAQDGRRKVILEAWSLGNTNGKSISRTLACIFGGKTETHRKFIQRFEEECQKRLSAVS